MFAPPLVLELAVPVDPALVAPPAAPPVLLLVPLVPLLMLEPLVLEPLLMVPVLSPDAGATAPLAVAVSVVLALLLLLHAATAAKAAATIAMRFMKSSVEIITRERCATFSASIHSCT